MANGYPREDLQRLAQAKVDDAALLWRHDRYSNAYYLAGYAVELALKACISRQILKETLPDPKFIREVYSGHNLANLLKLAGLQREHKDRLDSDAYFAANWALVVEWSPEARYKVTDKYTAGLMLDAVQNSNSGIFPWIKNYW